MLIQPAQQSATQVAGYLNSVTPSGVEQEAVRADIPPVIESEKDASAQNERYPTQAQAALPAAVPEQSESQGQQQAEPTQNASAQKSDQQERSQSQQQSTALSEDDLALLQQLKARDREVRVHEAAHASVGGRYAGSASLEYARGPDGKNYAVGGEVSISTSAVSGDPQSTIEKARVIQAAALAPAQPSSQDRRVAAKASQMEIEARSDLQTMKAEELQKEKQARTEKDEEAQALKEAEAASQKPEVEQDEPVKPVVVSIASSKPDESSDAESSESGDAETERSERPNAREELEKILLGSTGLLQQANQKGLVDPQNPYGKSGFLDIIA